MELCGRLGVTVHRGPLDDVLGRFVGAIEGHPGTVVRVTADCPLIDPAVVDDVVSALDGSAVAAYSSNVEPRTFPDGLDVEAVGPRRCWNSTRSRTRRSSASM